MGISAKDKFASGRFDLVMSTLVFSELSHEERVYALKHAYRVLKPGARLAIADEARPGSFWKRLIHGAIPLPSLLVTLIITRATTRAVEKLPDLVREAGFKIESEVRQHLDSFIYIVAIKGLK